MRQFKSNNMLKNLIVVFSGVAGGQFLSIVLSPLITRLYSPTDLGELGLFLTIASTLGAFVTLTYPVAIVLSTKKEEIHSLIIISLISTLVLSIISVGSIAIFSSFYSNSLSNYGFQYFFLLVTMTIFYGLFQIQEQLFIKDKKFKEYSKVIIIHSLFLQFGKVLVGWFSPTFYALILIGWASEMFKIFLAAPNRLISLKKNSISFLQIKRTAYKYRDFPLFRAPDTLINALSHSIPVILLFTLYGPSVVGFYTLCRSVMNAPVLLIGKTVGDVIYPKMNELYRNQVNMYKVVLKYTTYLSLVSLIPILILVLYGEEIFSIIFGEEWTTAGSYAQWIALFTFISIVNIPSIKLLPIISQQVLQLKFTVIMFFLRIGSILVGFYYYSNDVVSIALFSIVGVLMNTLLILFTLKKIRH